MIIFPILMAIGSIGFFIGLPVGIFYLVKARGEQDLSIKKRLHRKAIWSIFGPLLILIVSIVLFGIVTVLLGNSAVINRELK